MRRLLMVVLLAATALLAGCAGAPDRPDSPMPPGDEVPAANSLGEADIAFLQAMVAHTEQSVEIARSVEDRINNPELTVLVAAVEVTEFDENAMTRAWLQAVDSDSTETSGAQPTGQAIGDGGAARLRDMPDEAVDAVLCDLLGTHHRAAAELARLHAGAGDSPQVLAYARRVEQSRTAGAAHLDRLSPGDR